MRIRGTFIHTHLHSEHSAFDGMSKIKELVDRAAYLEAPAIALTDHGSVSGWPELHKYAYGTGVMPIFGVEAYVVEDKTMHVRQRRKHLCLLAISQTGYRNLVKLASLSAMFFYYKPVIDLAALEEFNEGIIATTACLGGWCAAPFFSETGYEGCGTGALAEAEFARLREVFGNRLYLEIQPYPQESQRIFNEWALGWYERDGVPLIATNDVHYVDESDAEYHRYFIMAGMGAWARKGSDGYNDQVEKYASKPGGNHMRTRVEMAEAFAALHGQGILRRRALWSAMEAPLEVFARAGAVRFDPDLKIPRFVPSDPEPQSV